MVSKYLLVGSYVLLGIAASTGSALPAPAAVERHVDVDDEEDEPVDDEEDDGTDQGDEILA